MHKKLLYTFVILAMLFGAFGMMGPGGVTPVAAATGWNQQPADAFGPANWTPNKWYQQTIGVPWSNAAGSPYHGAFNNTMADSAANPGSITAGLEDMPMVTYLNIYAEQQGVHNVRLAAGLFEQDFTEIPGQVATAPAAGEALSACLVIPANTEVFVVLARTWNFMTQPGANNVDIYLQRTTGQCGLIVQSDAIPGTEAQVYSPATGVAQKTLVDANGIAWFDIPAGIYNLGFAEFNWAFPTVARYVSVPAGGFVRRAPFTDSQGTGTIAQLRSRTPEGAAVSLDYRLMPDDAMFGFDFDIGIWPDGTNLFVTPGPWTINGSLEQIGAPDYNLFSSRMYNAGASTANDWRLDITGGIVAARVRMCVPAARDNAVVHMEVPPFEPQVFSFFNGGLTSPVGCPVAADGTPTVGGLMYLSTGVDYNAYFEVHETSGGVLDQYLLNAVPYPFPITTPGVLQTQYTNILANKDGDTFFSATSIVGGPEFVKPVDEVVHTRDIWTDASGNHLFEMILDGEQAFPMYALTRGLAGGVLLAEDWETDDFISEALIGRYLYEGWLPTGGFGVTAVDYDILYAVSPTDTRMLGHWAWSWVLALYEAGYTGGIDANNYGPDNVMSRAEMAVFLSKVMSDISTIADAPDATGTVFTDVAEDYWAAKYIEHLADLGITAGFPDGTFMPDAGLTRAEMSKFIQLAFRAADMFGAGIAHWDTSQNVLAPGTTFVDVPAEHWANLWIEEMAFDELTDGCRTEMSGLVFINYFCPEDLVTRGQMAKFVNTALQTNAVTQWLWPVLSPER